MAENIYSSKNDFKEKNSPLLTIVTVVFNGKQHLQQTIDSVIKQSYPSKEYIIIDGGSTDGTTDVIKSYSDKIDYWVSEPDRGIYDAMNKGALQAKGKYLLFLNAQDELVVNLGKLDGEFRKDYALIYGKTNLVYSPHKHEIRGEPLKDKNMLFDSMPTSHQAIFYRRAFFEKYDLSYKIIADRVSTYKMIKRVGLEKVKFVPYVIANYYTGGYSDSNNLLFTQEKHRFRKEMKATSIFHNVIYFLNKNFRYKYPIFTLIEKAGLFDVYRKLKKQF